MTISVVILTLDEERNLPGALASLRGLCDDVVVFDSFSSDRTCDIAREAGARVVQRRFDDYASQRRVALTDVKYKHEWVLMLDADERVEASLWEEMGRRVAGVALDCALFRMRRKDHFMGKWIKHSSGYPTWFGRLVRPGRVRVERSVNEEYTAEGSVGYLEGHLLHYPFERGLAHWIDRHNRYSTMEAAIVAQEGSARPRFGDLLSRDPTFRRKALKSLGYLMPLRPVVVFLYLYILRGGFLDGGPGLHFCALRGVYEFFIDLKLREAR